MGRHNRCYCEKGMYWRNNNAAWETSYFIDVGEHVMAAKDLHGDFKVGDGRGGSEFRIGNKNTKEGCLRACYEQKLKKDQRINGVTYGPNMGMTNPIVMYDADEEQKLH